MLDGVHPRDREHLEPILDETRVLERLVECLRTVTLSRGRHAAAPPRADRPGCHRRRGGPRRSVRRPKRPGVALVTEVDRRPADDRDRSRADPRGSHQPRSQTPSGTHPRAGRWPSVAGSPQTRSRSTVRGHRPGDRAGPSAPRLRALRPREAGSHGSRLGLAISRGLVEAHGGSISVASLAGDGTTSRVILPRTRRRVSSPGESLDDGRGAGAAYGLVMRTSSTAASTVLMGAASAAAEDDPDRLTGPRSHGHRRARPGRRDRCSLPRRSCLTRVRWPSAVST